MDMIVKESVMKCNNPKCGKETDRKGVHICQKCGHVANLEVSKKKEKKENRRVDYASK